MAPRVVAVDVGSVRSNFAWAALDLPGRRPVGEGGTHPEGAALAVIEAINAGVPVALGFEAPLMVPVSPVGSVDGWRTLGQARQGETVEGRSRQLGPAPHRPMIRAAQPSHMNISPATLQAVIVCTGSCQASQLRGDSRCANGRCPSAASSSARRMTFWMTPFVTPSRRAIVNSDICGWVRR